MTIDSAICQDCDIRLEATFELSPLACLYEDDQIFVIEFLKCHGSIKQMEKLLSVSYPTVKNRLTNIASKLTLSDPGQPRVITDTDVDAILDAVRSETIGVDEAISRLRE